MTITLYHNPKCGTSRNVLAIIIAAGHTPVIVDYMKTGWTTPQLQTLLKKMAVGPAAILRAKEPLAAGLENASDDALLAAMVQHPVLVNRPIVVTNKGAKLCRPAELVEPLL